MIKPLWAFAGIALLGSAALGATLVVVRSGGEEEVQQEAPAEREEDRLTKGLEEILAEEEEPPFIGDKLGIYIIGTSEKVDVPSQYVTNEDLCAQGSAVTYPPWDEAGELGFSVDLPPEYVFLRHDPDSIVGACNGVVVNAKRKYDHAGAGEIVIGRSRLTIAGGMHWPEDRVKVTTIGGRDAVIMEPIYPEGYEFGGTTTEIIFPEPFGKTFVFGNGVPLAEVLEVAEIMATASR